MFSADKFREAKQFFVEAYQLEYSKQMKIVGVKPNYYVLERRRNDLEFQRNSILARSIPGCTNIMLLGHIGTGKSSLINSIFNAIHRKIDDYKEVASVVHKGLLATTSVRRFDILHNIQLIDMPGINLDQSVRLPT